MLSKLENGKTLAQLDLVFALSVALAVAPVHLFAPLDDDAVVMVTPERAATAVDFRRWIRGFVPRDWALPDAWDLSGEDKRSFAQTNVPWSEHEQFLERLRTAGIDEETIDDIRSGIGGPSPWPEATIERKGIETAAKLDAYAAAGRPRQTPKREKEDKDG
jgi:hypothetical protein